MFNISEAGGTRLMVLTGELGQFLGMITGGGDVGGGGYDHRAQIKRDSETALAQYINEQFTNITDLGVTHELLRKLESILHKLKNKILDRKFTYIFECLNIFVYYE